MQSVYILMISTVVLMATGNSFARSVYKWLDDEGQVHFSDRAPQGRQAEMTGSISSSGDTHAYRASGLRDTERKLLDISRRREDKVLQDRQRFLGKHAAVKASCRKARARYDREKRKPGAAKSKLVKNHYEEMRELCR